MEKIINAKHFIDSNYQYDISLNEISQGIAYFKVSFYQIIQENLWQNA